MSGRATPRVFSIPAGVPFLPRLARALLDGELVAGAFRGADPLALADTTIYVPTRRAARELRSVLAEAIAGEAAILPVVRALGEFDEDELLFEGGNAAALEIAPPVSSLDRILMLAPLVKAWKRRLPAHIAALFAESVVVPASTADAIWLSRDLAALMDELETEGSDWRKLTGLVADDLAQWWQVTLEFLQIATTAWPQLLAELGRSNPAAHRSAMIRAEADRLARMPPRGPIIAAGSTGSVPATAQLLSVIARLPQGAVVLPGLDKALDRDAWDLLGEETPEPSLLGHPQYGLSKLLRRIGLDRADVADIGAAAAPLVSRMRVTGEALRPAETTERWGSSRRTFGEQEIEEAFSQVTLVEAANERDEATAIAIALKQAISEPGSKAALVTTDRALARRVSAELLRFGIRADDSGGVPLARTPPATLLRLLVEAACLPGDPVTILSLLKHPLLRLGLDRASARHAAETVELVALRGGTGRPEVDNLRDSFDARLEQLADRSHPPFWAKRLGPSRIEEARRLLDRMSAALAPLCSLPKDETVPLKQIAQLSVVALEELGRDQDGSVRELYAGDAGEKLASFLRGVIAAPPGAPETAPAEWPDVLSALLASETVKPSVIADGRISIWGALEARLQTVDTLVLGGLNEGSWPRRAEADRFMSRMMKTGMDLEPPERRIGLAAHDFWMSMGNGRIILTRAARAGDAPAVPSRWLQRLLTFLGPEQASKMRLRGNLLLDWARRIDDGPQVEFARRPNPTPPVEARPKRFSVTEIETLRRDPYAVYARRILELSPMEPVVRDPGAAERGTLFHEIMHRFVQRGIDPRQADAAGELLRIGRECFAEAALPADVEAVWWPRFAALSHDIIAWERGRADAIASRHAEERATAIPVGATEVTLAGRADRIDLFHSGEADILDYKTGSSPSKIQAHTLLAPQLALEGALLRRGAFAGLGRRDPAGLSYVRFRANGRVEEESVLRHQGKEKTATDLSEEAWARLEKLLEHYRSAQSGYLSRALPFREGETEGDYDHLARVLEWSAGGDSGDAGGGDGE